MAETPQPTKKSMNNWETWSYAASALVILAGLLSLFANYKKERASDASKVEAGKKAAALANDLTQARAELTQARTDAAANHQALTTQLNQARRDGVALTNNLADLMVATDKLRGENQRQALMIAAATKQKPAPAAPSINVAQDAEIMRVFEKHPGALKAKIDEQRRSEEEETRALQIAISYDDQIRPRLQAALDAVFRALKRTSELEQLPLKFAEQAALPNRLILTVRERQRGHMMPMAQSLGEVVNAQLRTGERIRVEVMAGELRTDATEPSLGHYPWLSIRLDMPPEDDGPREVSWLLGFHQTGNLWFENRTKSVGGEIDSLVFSYVVSKLADYSVELAVAGQKKSR